jgi:hypothetical protein
MRTTDGSTEADDGIYNQCDSDHVEGVGVMEVALEGRQIDCAETHEGEKDCGKELEYECSS